MVDVVDCCFDVKLESRLLLLGRRKSDEGQNQSNTESGHFERPIFLVRGHCEVVDIVLVA